MIHTQYEQLSDEQLADLFHSSNWNQMNGSQRLAACQEVANRDALAHGMEPREVVADDLRGLDFGAYDPADGKIHLNSHVLEHGTVMDEKGNETLYAGSNAETLDTVFHENRHAYDAQLAQAVEDKQQGLTYNQAIIDDAQARGLDIDSIRAGDSVYVTPGANHDVYRVQSSERAAYEAGENGTRGFFESSQGRLGADPGFSAYTDRLENGSDTYAEAMSNLSTTYNDSDFDKTLDEQAQDIYFSEHKTDDQFTYGTPQSRAAARGIVQNTNGAQLAQLRENYGVTNEHYHGTSAAASTSAASSNTGEMETGAASASNIQAKEGASAQAGDEASGSSSTDSSSSDSLSSGSSSSDSLSSGSSSSESSSSGSSSFGSSSSSGSSYSGSDEDSNANC